MQPNCTVEEPTLLRNQVHTDPHWTHNRVLRGLAVKFRKTAVLNFLQTEASGSERSDRKSDLGRLPKRRTSANDERRRTIQNANSLF